VASVCATAAVEASPAAIATAQTTATEREADLILGLTILGVIAISFGGGLDWAMLWTQDT
jgi:hypothetical protein